MHRSLLVLSFLACLAGQATFAQAPKAKPAPPAKKAAAAPKAAAKPPGLGLKDGDRFIFIGDSITHQCLYTQYVEDFFYTRYPKLHLHFRNAGVGGDRAADALDRFDDDIASFKPTFATILLGMNDGSYRDFDAPTFKTYAEGMIKLMDKLDAIHCKVILMSPTMYDLQAFEQRVAKEPKRANNGATENYNGVLAYYGKWLQETARKRGYRFVDIFSPLNTHTVQQRLKDPAFTMIPDAVHPAQDGQLVMAYELLRQTGELGGVLGTGVRAVNGQWQPMNPAQVKDVAGDAGHTASYTVLPKCLPWVVPDDAQAGFKLTRAGHTGSQESHIAVGLAAGRYDLIINGQNVGVFDERMLGVHAEIEEDPDSPTHQQALKIALLNQQRNNDAIHPLRDLYGQRKGKLRAAKQTGDMKAFETWWAESRTKETELMKKAGAIEAEIYKANQVAPLKVEIKPAATLAPTSKPKKPGAKKAA
ncbi:MAG: SGNH/GDSL hydrolase family protein [Prosthecobacter sp.]|nr:SGNH/GDSL hydrolase family protein [Prosthecobacter sp.]